MVGDDQNVALGSTEDLAERARAAANWTEYEDALLALVIRLYDELPTGKREVDTFALKDVLWNIAPETSPSDRQVLSLFDALNSLYGRGLVTFRHESNGMLYCRPVDNGRDFAEEAEHAAWTEIFARRLSEEHLGILRELHDSSYQVDEDGIQSLTWVGHAVFLPTLARHADGSEPGYEDHEKAHRDLEALTEAGFVEERVDDARPTYDGCVRVEQSRPFAVFPDVIGPLELALGPDPRFAGAVRKLRDAVDQASKRPYANAEDAIKNAVSAVESAAQAITHEPGDLEKQVDVLQRRELMSAELANVTRKVYVWRGATPGVAHGGQSEPVVGEAEARLAIHIAAGLVAYLATRATPRKG